MAIAAVTMAWDDDFFLRRWLDYYSPRVGPGNTFVISHGGGAGARALCDASPHRVNHIELPRDPEDVDFDQRRWRMLSQFVSGLTGYFDAVLCTDVDELVVPLEPEADLARLATALPEDANFCVPGFDLFPGDPDAAAGASLGALCAGGLFSTFYSKSCILRKEVSFVPGAHGLQNEAPLIAPGAVLLHLKHLPQAETQRRNKVRRDMAQAAYRAADATREELLAGIRPLAPWLNPHGRAAKEYRKFLDSEVVSWQAAVQDAGQQLRSCRVQKGCNFRFRRHPVRPLRAPLPDWMRALF